MTNNAHPGFIFLFFGGGGGEGGWYASKVVGIERMTKNPKSRIFDFSLFCEGEWVGGGGGGFWAGQGEKLAGKWEKLFSYVTHCINPIHINFRQGIAYGYLVMA